MSARCPRCDKLVTIRTLRVEPSGRYVYWPIPHDAGEALCAGGEIR